MEDDRKQRLEGKVQEIKGKAKQQAGMATGDDHTRAEGVVDELKGKAENAIGKARSAVEKATR